MNGVLLGEDANVTQAQSDFVIAELADVTQYTDVTPIRLPKGTLHPLRRPLRWCESAAKWMPALAPGP